MPEVNLFGETICEKAPISRETLAEQLFFFLRELTLEEFVSLIVNKFDAILEYAELANGKKTCQKTSLLFNPQRLDMKTKKNTIGQFARLKERGYCDGLARAILCLGLSPNVLYQALQLGVQGADYVGEFPPHVARELLLEHNCDAHSEVLDPCAGWGGRMIGVSVVANFYEAFEPATKTFEGLKSLFDFIKILSPEFNCELHKLPFEEAKLELERYDFALTSPPYYDTEKYSEEETNSLNRYKNFDAWQDGFFLPLIEKTMMALRPGKSFVLNIGSRKYPLNKILAENFSSRYEIKKLRNYLSGNHCLNRKGEGETFYEIKKGEHK
jgi:hypothetical protein